MCLNIVHIVLSQNMYRIILKTKFYISAKSADIHVISDSMCDLQVAAQVQNLGLKHLSTEWIIQCLIQGQRVAYTGHPRYRWDYKS